MGYIRLIIRQLWFKWFKPLNHITYITFKKSLSDDIKFYKVYCKPSPSEITYDTLHFEVYPTQIDPLVNTRLRANLTLYLLPGIMYNIGITAVNSIGNESDIVKVNDVIL